MNTFQVAFALLFCHYGQLTVAKSDVIVGQVPTPLTKVEILAHGIHCVDVVEKCIDSNQKNETNSKIDEMEAMHCYHCRRLMQLIKRFQDANPNLIISTEVCSLASSNRVRRELVSGLFICYHDCGRKRRRRDTETELKSKQLGQLLLKDYKGARLSVDEAKYLQQIEGEMSVIGATEALHCTKGSKMAKLQVVQLVKQSHDICWQLS